jgi:lysophospholipase L1-like esterase
LKWFKQPAALLFYLLATSALLMAAAGVVLKYSTARESPQIQETLAIAVPFVLVRGDVLVPDPPSIGNKARGESPVHREEISGPGGAAEQEPPPAEEKPLFTFQMVEESYFDKVLFVGDSRTEGLKMYGRLGSADYFANAGMSVFNLFDKVVADQNFTAQSLRQLLGSREYETIYLMLGINEVGYPHNSLEKQYASVVRQIRELAPNAVLVLQGNLGVTRSKAEKQAYFSPESVGALNGLIAALADGKTTFYLPPADIFSDEEGYLKSDITGDGVHPYAAEYQDWAAWLKDHGLVRVQEESAGTEELPGMQMPEESATVPDSPDEAGESETTVP